MGSYDASRRLSIVLRMIVFGFISAVFGCSGTANPTTVLHSGAVGIRDTQISGGGWSTKAPMPTARGFLASGVVNGILYAVGGETCSICVLETVEAYDPASNTWSTKALIPTPRGGLAAGVINGILYAVGGVDANGLVLSTVEAYDPTTDTWATKASMPKARWGLAAGVVNGILYAVGGSASANYPTRSTKSTVFAYDPVTDTWSEKASMPKARFGLAVAVVKGKLYAVGGNNYRGNMNTVQAYDPATNTWATRASIPMPRTELAASVVNGRIFVVGGCNEKDCRIAWSTLEAFDPETNTWTSEPSMPTARGILTAGVVKGILYAVGGFCGYSNPCDTVEAFSP